MEAAHPGGLLELELPHVNEDGALQVNFHLPGEHSEEGIRARLWDFDRTIIDLENGYRAWVWCAVCQMLNFSPAALKEKLPGSDITREQAWSEIFKLAFGLPTDKTNETVVEILSGSPMEDPSHAVRAAGRKEFRIQDAPPEIQSEYERLQSAYRKFERVHEGKVEKPADLLAQMRHESMIMFLAVTGEGTGELNPVTPDASAYGRSIWQSAAEAAGMMRLQADMPMLWPRKGEDTVHTFRGMVESNLEALRYMSDLHFEVLPGVLNILRDSKERGLAQGIASSSDRLIVETVLSCLKLHLGGYEELFDAVKGCQCVPSANRKPSGYPYLALIEEINKTRTRAGLPPIRLNEAVVFEDNATGSVAAGLAGPAAVVVCPSADREGDPFPQNTAGLIASFRKKLESVLRLDDVSAAGSEVLAHGYSRIAVLSADSQRGHQLSGEFQDFLQFFENGEPFQIMPLTHSPEDSELSEVLEKIARWNPECIVVFPEDRRDIVQRLTAAGFDPARIFVHTHHLRILDFIVLPSLASYIF